MHLRDPVTSSLKESWDAAGIMPRPPPLGNPVSDGVGWGLGRSAVSKHPDDSGLQPGIGATAELCFSIVIGECRHNN